jgi:hypothetical protein
VTQKQLKKLPKGETGAKNPTDKVVVPLVNHEKTLLVLNLMVSGDLHGTIQEDNECGQERAKAAEENGSRARSRGQ